VVTSNQHQGRNPYFPTPESVLERSLAAARECLGDQFREFKFVDLGSGRGRVCEYWLKHTDLEIHGIECDPELIPKASTSVHYREQDVLDWDPQSYSWIIYLFNPFNEDHVRHVLQTVQGASCLIYVLPVHDFTVRSLGWHVLHEESPGDDPTQWFKIYRFG
jgi:hypothetical protein